MLSNEIYFFVEFIQKTAINNFSSLFFPERLTVVAEEAVNPI